MESRPYGWWLPLNASVHGQGIDRLINILHLFMAALFVGWGIYLIYCLVRFRKRDGETTPPPERKFRLPFWLEVGVVIFELALLVFVSTPIWFKIKNDFPKESDALVLRIVGEQYAWNVHYPGRDGKFGKTRPDLVDGTNPLGLDREDADTKDDITTVNLLHVPVGKPVIVYLSSKDVIHSFTLPTLRVKQDVVPGMVTPIWFQANDAGLNLAGKLQMTCAQLCGIGHSVMVGQFYIDTPEEFGKWIAEREKLLEP